jgi:transposase
MRFQVPQFIEVEDKVFGPLTVKQFIYIAGGGGLSFIIWSLVPLPLIFKLVIILPVLAFSFALAFYKINNKPFINVVEAAFKYFFTAKLYIWRKAEKRAEVAVAEIRTRRQGNMQAFLYQKYLTVN